MKRLWSILISLLFLIVFANGSYNNMLAKKLAYYSGATECTKKQIQAWKCKYCSYSKLQSIKVFKNYIFDVSGYTGYSIQENAIIVAFKSPIAIKDWITNLDADQVDYPYCQGCKAYQIFYNEFQRVQSMVKSQMQELLTKHGGAKIYVTGFSLGSAVAAFGALYIKKLYGRVDQFYSFGQPRIGNVNFADYFSSQISQHYRVIHNADIVSHLPLQTPIPYYHYAYEVWYDANMQKYKICDAEQFACSKSIPPFKWSSNDNDISKYVNISLTEPRQQVSQSQIEQIALNNIRRNQNQILE